MFGLKGLASALPVLISPVKDPDIVSGQKVVEVNLMMRPASDQVLLTYLVYNDLAKH